MFDLEKAIAAWRQFLRNNRAFVGDDLDELESHVRHQVAGLKAEGLSEKAAYRQTMREMGDFGTAEAEYRKVYWGKLRRRQQRYRELRWRLSMLRNYVKIALRNLAKHKVYSVVNIGGLALGMAVCVLILLFVREEISYDEYQLYKDRIFRIQRGRLASDGSVQDNFSTLAPAFVPLLEGHFPALEHVARMFKPDDFSLTYGENTFVEQGGYFAEADLFEVLTLPLVSGDQRTALQEPGSLIEVTFLDERIDALYRREARMMKITGFFGLLAVLIACLGLFGLATFMAERRTREVGVRKVFGASGFAIMRLLSTTFVKWVLVANVVAWPLAYLVMNRWLQDFAYQAEIGIEIFILATLISLVIAWLSVSYQAIRAARVNLVQSLKYE